MIFYRKFDLVNLTVEAEIKTIMRAQRVREGESRVEMQIVKWTAEGTGKGDRLVFCDVRHTSVAGNMKVFRKAHGSFRESRWHRG